MPPYTWKHVKCCYKFQMLKCWNYILISAKFWISIPSENTGKVINFSMLSEGIAMQLWGWNGLKALCSYYIGFRISVFYIFYLRGTKLRWFAILLKSAKRNFLEIFKTDCLQNFIQENQVTTKLKFTVFIFFNSFLPICWLNSKMFLGFLF